PCGPHRGARRICLRTSLPKLNRTSVADAQACARRRTPISEISMSHPAVDAIWRERRLASMRAEIEASKDTHPPHAHPHHGYDPTEPRVPAGNPDGGQWTSTGGIAGVRVATGPTFWREFLREIVREIAKEAIEDYRKREVDDLAGETDDTVALTILDGIEVLGVNSTSRPYTPEDYARALRLRDDLIRKNPDVMKQKNVGQKPNDAVFHAETTLLLRAAERNGGTLT